MVGNMSRPSTPFDVTKQRVSVLTPTCEDDEECLGLDNNENEDLLKKRSTSKAAQRAELIRRASSFSFIDTEEFASSKPLKIETPTPPLDIVHLNDPSWMFVSKDEWAPKQADIGKLVAYIQRLEILTQPFIQLYEFSLYLTSWKNFTVSFSSMFILLLMCRKPGIFMPAICCALITLLLFNYVRYRVFMIRNAVSEFNAPASDHQQALRYFRNWLCKVQGYAAYSCYQFQILYELFTWSDVRNSAWCTATLWIALVLFLMFPVGLEIAFYITFCFLRNTFIGDGLASLLRPVHVLHSDKRVAHRRAENAGSFSDSELMGRRRRASSNVDTASVRTDSFGNLPTSDRWSWYGDASEFSFGNPPQRQASAPSLPLRTHHQRKHNQDEGERTRADSGTEKPLKKGSGDSTSSKTSTSAEEDEHIPLAKKRSSLVDKIHHEIKFLLTERTGSCSGCSTSFTFIKRVYCRRCGAGYCQNCCSKKIAKSFLGVTSPQAAQEKVLVCGKCYKELTTNESDEQEAKSISSDT
eukprot:Colp12_sorted_trinity150504_noHs@24734